MRELTNTHGVAFDEAIRVRDLVFHYPGKEDEVILNRVSLDVPRNKSCAIIGATGSGKTTLADIIMGIIMDITMVIIMVITMGIIMVIIMGIILMMGIIMMKLYRKI